MKNLSTSERQAVLVSFQQCMSYHVLCSDTGQFPRDNQRDREQQTI